MVTVVGIGDDCPGDWGRNGELKVTDTKQHICGTSSCAPDAQQEN